jgi:hypothetical protein
VGCAVSPARLEELLSGFTPEERIKLRPPDYAADFLSASVPTVYRWAAAGILPHIKLDGADRGERGRAGALRFTLEGLVRFAVEREVSAGGTAPVPAGRARVGRLLGVLAGRRP